MTATGDIEEAHSAACAAKQQMYEDPATGYWVMTEFYLKEKQECCGNACRHCPYGHSRVKDGSRRKNKIAGNVFLKSSPTKNGDLDSVVGNSISDNLEFSQCEGVIVMFWSGGKDSFLTLVTVMEQIRKERTRIVLLTTIDPETNKVPSQNISVADITAQAASLNLPILLAPRGADTTNATYIDTVTNALSQIETEMHLMDKTRNSQIQFLVFGDLFLKDIRAWREDSFSGMYPCRFPLFEKGYGTVLFPRLWRICCDFDVRICFSAIESKGMKTWLEETRGGERDGEGRFKFTKELVESADWPKDVDLMGENGEFHTIVQFVDMWDSCSH
ncbi:hypothetical protein HDU98_006603 [Podochytrium sp. JEL0797]|nr:hypothetical protein HDU98_006603 [Podochytrium sp. JEL0797]